MEHSARYNEIMTRYKSYFITDSQLARYKKLGIITESEYKEIYAINHNNT